MPGKYTTARKTAAKILAPAERAASAIKRQRSKATGQARMQTKRPMSSAPRG